MGLFYYWFWCWSLTYCKGCFLFYGSLFYLHWQFPFFKKQKQNLRSNGCLPCLTLIFKSIYVLCIIESFYFFHSSSKLLSYDVAVCSWGLRTLRTKRMIVCLCENSFRWSRNSVENPWEHFLLMTWKFLWIILWINDLDSENHCVCVMMSSMRFWVKWCLKAIWLLKTFALLCFVLNCFL